MEFIEINGVRTQVPQDVVAQGRDAVVAWAAQQARTPTRSAPAGREE